MARVCVFDVNETLLDMGALDPHFERVFGDASARPAWFDRFLQLWLTETVTGSYQKFGTVAGLALEMLAGERGVALPDEDKQAIVGGIAELPPHPEVEEGLRALKDAGLRLATLTNSTQEVADAQMRNSGLGELFEMSLSADGAGRLKPAPEPYRMAAESLGVPIGEIRLVAAHGWDVVGAMRAGCAAAFVARPGKALFPTAPPPDVVGADMLEVAAGIITAKGMG